MESRGREPLRSRSIYPGIAPLHHGLQRAKALLPTRYRWPCREHVPSAVSAGPQLKRRRRASTMKPHTTVPVSNSVFQKPYIDIQTSEKYSIPQYHETKPSSNYPHLHLITGTCNFKIESPSSLSLSLSSPPCQTMNIQLFHVTLFESVSPIVYPR